MAEGIKKRCVICTPHCVRDCPIVKHRRYFSRSLKCPECKTRFEIEQEVCQQCGFKIESICLKCGALNSWVENKCSECGFSHVNLNKGFSQWYMYKPKSKLGELAEPPGQPIGSNDGSRSKFKDCLSL